MDGDKVSLEDNQPEWTKEYNPYTLQAAAVEEKTVPAIKEFMETVRARCEGPDYRELRNMVFQELVQSEQMPLIAYMLDHDDTLASSIQPIAILEHASKPLIDALVAHGWDINTQNHSAMAGPTTGRKRLLDYLVTEGEGKESLARWLVEEKGAKLDGYTDGHGEPPPPLLETCAARGTVAMYRFLEEHGARPCPRALHLAAVTAASRRTDPAHDESTSAEMLRFLVEERGADVNGIDSDVSHQPMNTHFGTPIAYAARCPSGTAVVKWLLEKGADPSIKNPFYPPFDAFECAREKHSDEILSILQAWKEQNTSIP